MFNLSKKNASQPKKHNQDPNSRGFSMLVELVVQNVRKQRKTHPTIFTSLHSRLASMPLEAREFRRAKLSLQTAEAYIAQHEFGAAQYTLVSMRLRLGKYGGLLANVQYEPSCIDRTLVTSPPTCEIDPPSWPYTSEVKLANSASEIQEPSPTLLHEDLRTLQRDGSGSGAPTENSNPQQSPKRSHDFKSRLHRVILKLFQTSATLAISVIFAPIILAAWVAVGIHYIHSSRNLKDEEGPEQGC